MNEGVFSTLSFDFYRPNSEFLYQMCDNYIFLIIFHPLVKLLSLEKTKKNKIFLCIFLTYS